MENVIKLESYSSRIYLRSGPKGLIKVDWRLVTRSIKEKAWSYWGGVCFNKKKLPEWTIHFLNPLTRTLIHILALVTHLAELEGSIGVYGYWVAKKRR